MRILEQWKQIRNYLLVKFLVVLHHCSHKTQQKNTGKGGLPLKGIYWLTEINCMAKTGGEQVWFRLLYWMDFSYSKETLLCQFTG